MPAAPLVALEYSGVELYPHDRHQLGHAHFDRLKFSDINFVTAELGSVTLKRIGFFCFPIT